MAFDSVAAFLHMGGHALYVWLAYVIAFAVMAFIALWPVRRSRRLLHEQALRQRREANADGAARWEQSS